MRIEQLELRDFRNYAALKADFHPERNVIIGENAQGKTNLLEAIFCLSGGASHRSRQSRDLIRFGTPAASITARAWSREREFLLELEFFQDRPKTVAVNRVRSRSAADLGGIVRTVLFQPEDLLLIREGAAARRKFLDTALCQLRPAYAQALGAYNRALAQKARILRDGAEHPRLLSVLPEFNEQLIQYGAVLIRYRHRFTQRLREYAGAFHQDCAGGREALDVRYRTVSTINAPSGPTEALRDALRRHMGEHSGAELAARLCLSGPHRDDLEISIGGRDARRYASQGQTRTAALALKLAEREIFKNAAGEYPVLLLDDVLSELDPRRQEFVLNRTGEGQVFLTCCEEDRLALLRGGKTIHIHNGTTGGR